MTIDHRDKLIINFFFPIKIFVLFQSKLFKLLIYYYLSFNQIVLLNYLFYVNICINKFSNLPSVDRPPGHIHISFELRVNLIHI